jgi:hypothetical protein
MESQFVEVFVNITLFLECGHSCFTCVMNDSKCTSCLINGTDRLDNSKLDNTCPCIYGYLDDGINLSCLKCDPMCQTCEE